MVYIRINRLRWVPAVVVACLATTPAWSTSVLSRNLVELTDLSENILIGTVLEVSDGFERDVPYTEITLQVEESIRGDAGPTYTFRQFGLTEPRTLPDGRVYLGQTPDGWPRFAAGEQVMLFLYRRSPTSGLQTTVGLMQGKFDIRDGRIANGVANQGLFKGVEAHSGAVSSKSASLLSMQGGSLPLEPFVEFVRELAAKR